MKVNSLKDLKILFEQLGADHETGDGWASWTLNSKKLQASSTKPQAPGSKDLGITTSGKPEFDHDWVDKSIIND